MRSYTYRLRSFNTFTVSRWVYCPLSSFNDLENIRPEFCHCASDELSVHSSYPIEMADKADNPVHSQKRNPTKPSETTLRQLPSPTSFHPQPTCMPAQALTRKCLHMPPQRRYAPLQISWQRTHQRFQKAVSCFETLYLFATVRTGHDSFWVDAAQLLPA